MSPLSPIAAVVPSSRGNICCLFTSTQQQYLIDTYGRSVMASAASADAMVRYFLAGALPLFSVQMHERLGAGWVSTPLGFIAVVLLYVPWVSISYGLRISVRSSVETTQCGERVGACMDIALRMMGLNGE